MTNTAGYAVTIVRRETGALLIERLKSARELTPPPTIATATATRRLAAIQVADVVGYSRLVRADEEGTHERFKAHLVDLIDPKIREHHGRIVKTTGDGALAEFASVVYAGAALAKCNAIWPTAIWISRRSGACVFASESISET
jgi:class 3 adenylate cyclase